MNRIACALSVAALTAATAPLAHAGFSPPGPRTVSGPIVFQVGGSPPYACTLTASAAVTSTTMTLTAGALSPGGFPCAAIIPSFSPGWIVTPTASSGGVATQLDIANVAFTTLTGTCRDTLEVSWNAAASKIVIPSQAFGSGSPTSCRIQGELTVSPAVAITVP